MKILVTGGAGYIGAVLCRMLLERGHDVRVVDRFFFGREPLRELDGRVELVDGDLRDWDPRWLDGVDAVSHLAGLSNDPTAEYNPTANWEMNAVATERIAAACKAAGVPRLVFGSSASIYDGIGPGTYDETVAVQPRGAYSISKKYAEEALLSAADDAFSPVILRQGTAYGWSPRIRFDLVVNTFVRDALTYRRLYLHGGGRQWRPLVDVSDIARAHIAAIDAPREAVHAEIFNVVEENYQIRQLAMLVAGSLSMKGRTVELVETDPPRLARDYRAANLKMTQRLGFTPAVTVLDAIDVLLEKLPLDDLSWLTSPRHANIAWMTIVEEVHGTQRPFASVY